MELDRKDQLLDGKPGGPLVVVLHGLRGSPAKMAGVVGAVRETFPDATIFVPHLPYANFFTFARAELIAATVVAKINCLMADGDHARIILAGHSMGSLIARKTAIIAHGECAGAPFEPKLSDLDCKPRPWAAKIDRVIMLAGMARGWSLNTAGSPLVIAVLGAVILFGDVFLLGAWTVLRARQGAPFIVQTRLQWLALVRHRHDDPIKVVQLLGSQDNTVAPDDTVDFAVDAGSRNFALMELPYTDHRGAIVMNDDGGIAEDRKDRFKRALSMSLRALRTTRDGGGNPFAMPNTFAVNGAAPDGDPKVTDVVFVIHGIRDRGFWTRKIARKVMEQVTQSDRKVRAMTLSYGYLAMAPFVLPWVRRAKVRWMMDAYAEWRALYPNADFYYVGHSNGTYLAARALRDYPAARFKRIVFAGSVVKKQYKWETAITGKWRQVDAVMNYVASKDWVVAIFPNGLSWVPLLDLGSAGHHGFRDLIGARRTPQGQAWVSERSFANHPDPSYQIDYVAGGHGAGIRESQWDDIARFVAHGTAPSYRDPDFVPRQPLWARAIGWMPPWSLLGLVAIVALIGYGLLKLGLFLTPTLTPILSAYLPLVAAGLIAVSVGWGPFALYLVAVYMVITRG